MCFSINLFFYSTQDQLILLLPFLVFLFKSSSPGLGHNIRDKAPAFQRTRDKARSKMKPVWHIPNFPQSAYRKHCFDPINVDETNSPCALLSLHLVCSTSSMYICCH
jgi:hypothetical protein